MKQLIISFFTLVLFFGVLTNTTATIFRKLSKHPILRVLIITILWATFAVGTYYFITYYSKPR